MNANLDSREWRRCHLPETLSWIQSSSITLIGDILIGICMNIIGITPIDVLSHIRMIWDTEMANLQNIRDATEEPIYGIVAGDEPPPPPRIKMYYYFQLNTKHCISLHRAIYIFYNISRRAPHRFDCYLLNICGMLYG